MSKVIQLHRRKFIAGGVLIGMNNAVILSSPPQHVPDAQVSLTRFPSSQAHGH